MKIFLLTIGVLFLVAPPATAQERISLVTPVSEAELVESSGPNSVGVILALKAPDSDTETQALLDDVLFGDCTATSGTKTATVAAVAVNDPNDKMHRICTFAIGTAANNLPPDWTKFTLQLKYRVRENGVLGTARVFRGLSPISRCVRVSNVIATLDSPLRTGEKEVTIPIKLNADVRLNAELRSDSGLVATPSGTRNNATVLFENGDQPQQVVFKVLSDVQLLPATVYTLSLKELSSQPPIQVQFKGSPERFALTEFRPYKMSAPTVTQSSDGAVQVQFATPTSGSMQVFLNGRKEPVHTDTATVNRNFPIASELIPAGINTLTFTGESAENRIKLSGNTPVSFNKEAQTRLGEKPINLNYEEATNTLKIEFSLTRKLDTRWQFKERGGLGANVIPKDAASNIYEASIPLNLSPENKELVESKLVDVANSPLKKAPVAIEIVNANRQTEVVATFVVNFIKPKDAVINKVKDADTLLGQNKKDLAKKAIAEALGFLPDSFQNNPEQKQTVETIISQLRQQPDTKSKVFKVLGIAGKIAAGLFGIPLPF